jgi:uncharacterized HAD superfamily protein
LPFKLRIAVDVDGVLLDTIGFLLRTYNGKYGTDHSYSFMNSWSWYKKLDMDRKEFFKLLKKIGNKVLSIPAISDMAHHYLFLLRDDEVDIVTGTLASEDLVKLRLEQLGIREGLEYKNFIRLEPDNKNAKYELGYDIYIDDNPKLAETIDDQNGKCFQILFNQPWNVDYVTRRNVSRVSNWSEVLEKVEMFRKILEPE